MTFDPSFLAGAQSRLLPVSVPFRFFVAGALFHLTSWILIALNADAVINFTGGLGVGLAAIHAVTLGVLVMSAIGASLQLLPVATRRTAQAIWPTWIITVLVMGGVPVLVWGMAVHDVLVALWGGAAVGVGLAVYAVLIGANLFHAKGLKTVVAFCWAALVALGTLVVLGLLLVLDFDLGVLNDHATLAGVHFVVAVFGFMGLLAFGFSFILIPMFTLSRGMPTWRGSLTLGVSLLAIGLACLGLVYAIKPVVYAAFASGLAASLLYLWTMLEMLKSGMRKRLGIPFTLIRLSWALLPLSLLVGVLALGGWIESRGWTLFGFMLLAGWLLTFLLGILLRIAPFLASMHSAVGEGRPARLSSLTPEWPQKILAVCHPSALILVGGGIVSVQMVPVQVGALIGVLGALAMLTYILNVIRRLVAHRTLSRSSTDPSKTEASP